MTWFKKVTLFTKPQLEYQYKKYIIFKKYFIISLKKYMYLQFLVTWNMKLKVKQSVASDQSWQWNLWYFMIFATSTTSSEGQTKF